MVTPLAVANGANFALGVFLLILAGIVFRRSADRAARGPLALYLVLVGFNYSLDAFGYGLSSIGVDDRPIRYVALAAAFLDPPLLLTFALISAYGPLSRMRRALIPLPAIAIAALYLLNPPAVPYMSQWPLRHLYLAEMTAYYLLAFAFLADAYVAETRTLQRDRLATLVVAFGLVCLPRVPLLMVDFGIGGAPATFLPLRAILTMVASLVAMTAVAWIVVSRRARGAPHAEHVRRSLRSLAGLCAVVGAQWVLLFVPGLTHAAYALLFSFRWFLFAAVFSAGLQRHDLLDLSDTSQRRVRTAFNGALLVVAIAQLASFFLVLPGATFGAAMGGSLGIVVIAGIGHAALRQAAPAPASDLAWRRQTLYRAHLELDAPPEELARLRERLQLTDREAREAEELVAMERSAPAPASDLEEGRRFLGRYDVQRFLGAGSFGRAYLAWDRHVCAHVVLKELLEGWRETPEALQRFRREAEIALRVDHPNLVGFRGLERTTRGHVLVLEYVEGETLRERLRRGPLPATEVAWLANELLLGLEALHKAGIVHRDVKPDNLVLRDDGTAVLLDFGSATGSTVHGTRLAGTGNPGTRQYMAPEQTVGQRVGPAADLYSTGVTLWEALTGRLPPEGAPPAAWQPVLERALQTNPTRRHASARAFREALPLARVER